MLLLLLTANTASAPNKTEADTTTTIVTTTVHGRLSSETIPKSRITTILPIIDRQADLPIRGKYGARYSPSSP